MKPTPIIYDRRLVEAQKEKMKDKIYEVKDYSKRYLIYLIVAIILAVIIIYMTTR